MKPTVPQKDHWDEVFRDKEAFFGDSPSGFACMTAEGFKTQGVRSVLELGCGQGRDTLHFARQGFEVTALDYAQAGLDQLALTASFAELSDKIHLQAHDVAQPLPFPDASFDACYAHMLLCMELRLADLAVILRQVHRVLKPGGLFFYSVRSTFDKHFGTGTHLGENLYDVDGFVIQFFSEAMVHQLAQGYHLEELTRIEEGPLPRDLFAVILKKGDPPHRWNSEVPTPELFPEPPRSKPAHPT